LSSFYSTSSAASSANSLVEMAFCSGNRRLERRRRRRHGDEDAADGNANGPAAEQDRGCALLFSFMRGDLSTNDPRVKEGERI